MANNGGRGQSARQSNSAADQIAIGLGWFSIGLGLAELLAPGPLSRLIGLNGGDKTRKLLRSYGVREIAAGVGILSQPGASGWLWSRVAGDAVDIASLGKALASTDNDRSRLTGATAAVLGVTALDIYCGQQLTEQNGVTWTAESRPYEAFRSVIIDRPPEEVYRFWRDFSNLPSFMNHLESVQTTGDRRSHWRAKGPAGTTVEWDAEMTRDDRNELIAWRSLEGSDVENSGTVRFDRAPGDRGTIVRVELRFEPPAGAVGSIVARMFGAHPEQQLEGNLRALKSIIETGDVVKSDASIHSGMHAAQPSSEPVESGQFREGAESLRPSLV